jgi:hypothetical protein
MLLMAASLALLAALVLGVSLAAGAPPTVTINPATEVHYTTAKVSGEIEPTGPETYYHFEVATEADFSDAESQDFGQIPGGAGPTPVEAELTGLHPATTYHLRLHVENSLGEVAAEAQAAPFTTEALATPVVSIEPVSGQTPTTAHLVGHINPESNQPEASTSPAEKAAFEVHWHFHCEPECPGLEGTVPADDTSHEVSALATGLLPGTVYEAELIAENAGGATTKASAGPTAFTTPAAPPTLSAPSVGAISGTEATLKAAVDPGGAPTTFHFEYVSQGLFEAGGFAAATSTPESASIGSDNESHPIQATVMGLSAGTTYHFRAVVTNTAAGDPVVTSIEKTFIAFAEVQPEGGQGCAEEAARPGLSALLPNCRAYELVTPAKKNGALIGKLFAFIPTQVSGDGSRLMAATDQCFPGAQSCSGNRGNEGAPYEYIRTAAGWTNRAMAPSAQVFPTSSYWTLSPDTRSALFSSPNPLSGEDDFYARTAAGAFVPIGPLGETAGARSGNYENLAKEGLLATADQSHLVYETTFSAWAFDEAESEGSNHLYEYTGAGNTQPILVGVSGGEGSTDLISKCGTFLGSPELSFAKLYRSLSTDGRTVFFAARTCASGSGANEGVKVPGYQVYARIDGETPAAHSVRLSAPTATSCTTLQCQENSGPLGAQKALFQGASEDGSVAFFTSTQQLTDTATQDLENSESAEGGCPELSDPTSGCNLYESICPDHCSEPSGRELIDVSTTLSGGPRVQATLAISPDGSHIYFVAEGLLDAAPNSLGQMPRSGGENLYVYERDPSFPSGRLRFIATLAHSDVGRPGSANVTPDGRLFVFTSHLGLTPDATRAEGPAQVYEFDDLRDELRRISIGQGGFNSDGNAGLGGAGILSAFSRNEAASVPERTDPTMSDDGSYIFFRSPVALTPRALDDVQVGTQTGGEPLYAQNIYEYHEGDVALISDGRDTSVGAGFPPEGSELVGTDRSGENVFIATADQLLGADTDTQRDIYDAHICAAAAPCPVAEPQPPAPCEAEGCRAAATLAPTGDTSASSTFSGPGNPKPARHHKQKKKKQQKKKNGKCPKGRKASHGKCVKQTKHKRANPNRGATR